MICPICKATLKAEPDKYRPFCSHRCQLIDLGNWLGERYTVPGEEVTDDNAASQKDKEEEKTQQG